MAKTKGTNLVDMAKLLPGSGEAPLVQIGRLNARMHLQATYAHLLEDARPSALPIRALALWKSMHDTGEFKLQADDDGADARLAGYGYPTPEMCAMLGALSAGALRHGRRARPEGRRARLLPLRRAGLLLAHRMDARAGAHVWRSCKVKCATRSAVRPSC